jgi:23S rRNA (uracil1939-C5)-methyltransferase
MPRKLNTMERRARRDVKNRSLARNLTAKQKEAEQAKKNGDVLKGHGFSQVSMGIRPTQVDESASAASAPEGPKENSPGLAKRSPGKEQQKAESPVGATEISPQIIKGIGGIFDYAAGRLKSTGPSGPEEHSPVAGKARSAKVKIAAAKPAEPQLVEIEKPIYGGAFLARVEGKAVFVPLTLPGEEALVRITESKHGYATAEAEEIIRAAPERTAPACQHFGVCGGCNYQHANYATQLAFKQAILRETLERGGVAVPDEIAVLSGEPLRYRNRIRLAFDAAGQPGYRGRRSHAVVPLRECPIAAPLLVEAALAFAQIAREVAPALRPTEITLFCDAAESALLATVSTASAAKIRFDKLSLALQEKIPALIGAELIFEGRPGKPPRALAEWGATSLAYRAAGFDYRVDHGAFFQVNRWLVDALVERVTAGHTGKLAWDLYAGVGLFARKLAARFERVVAVESAPSATAALETNLRSTGGAAITAETLAFLRGSRKPSKSAGPDLIVVDPPRTGLGAETCAQLIQIAAPALACVSCDPATLARDLGALITSGYQIQSITLADLFPQTFHLETVVQLRRA